MVLERPNTPKAQMDPPKSNPKTMEDCATEKKVVVATVVPAQAIPATANSRLIRSFTLFDNRDFLPRPFQIELYEACKNRDSIVFLRPGNGKHFIAVMLVKYFTPKRRLMLMSSDGGGGDDRPFKLNEFNSKRKIFFLTKSFNSIRQYAAVFFAHTDLKIGEYFSKSLSDSKFCTEEDWRKQLAQYDIHLMLDTMFDELIDQRFVGSGQISLLVLDDVHKILLTPGENCYTRIIRKLNHDGTSVADKKPFRILGLSASILIEDVASHIFQLMIEQIETALGCVCETYADLRMINKYSIQSRIRLRYYPGFFAASPWDEVRLDTNLSFKLSLFQIRNYAAQFYEFLSNLYDPKLSEQDNLVTNEMLKQSVVDVLLVLGSLGEWCALQLIALLSREIGDTIALFKATSSNYLKLLNSAYSTLQLVRQSILSYLPAEMRPKLGQYQPNKTKALPVDVLPAGQPRLSMKEFLQLSSPKLHLLANILKEYLCELFQGSSGVGGGVGTSIPTNSSLTFPSNICSIIYAENRSSARVLSLWIGELSAISSWECNSLQQQLSSEPSSLPSVQCPFSYLQPDYVFLRDDCSSLDSRNFYYEKQQKSLHEIFYYRRQEEVLKRFRFAHNCNLLITTSMAADGLDINRCNAVICFDQPPTFQKFIQSKGRLRVENGTFVVMVEATELNADPAGTDHSPYVAKFRQFCEIEKIFSKLVPLNNNVDIETGFSVDRFARFKSFTTTRAEQQASSSTPDQSSQSNATNDTQIDTQPGEAITVNGQPPSVPTPDTEKASSVASPNTVLLTLENAISILNRYCLKLPSDTFTKLAPHYYIDKVFHQPDVDLPLASCVQYQCRLYLPINSAYRDEIVGDIVGNRLLAKRSAAFKAVRTLRETGELDCNYYPIGKETNRYIEKLGLQECFVNNNSGGGGGAVGSRTITDRRNQTHPHSSSQPNNNRYNRLQARNIASKRRQYYNKKVSDCLRGQCFKSLNSSPDSGDGGGEIRIQFLYELRMKLTCPLPEEQNTRGRRIVDPAETERTFGIIVPKYLPPMCDFTIYNRSGEVTVSLHSLVSANSGDGLAITTRQRQQLYHFHSFTFENVLRLGAKSSIEFDCDQASNGNFVVVPILGGQIDWQFVQLIETESRLFRPDLSTAKEEQDSKEDATSSGSPCFIFKEELYRDAVIMPKYRRDKMQTFFYVAEICSNLSPLSRFPDNGFETFEEYYRKKYKLQISNLEQPLLDVDHTSSRLNLLTPRYLTRKGQALPATTAETKRTKRSNLQQKQILVPELCFIHPFPASFWRKAVCLPCMLYRLNSLLVAEEIRFKIAKEANIGCTDLPDGVHWPSLDFGWPTKDLITHTFSSVVGTSHNKGTTNATTCSKSSIAQATTSQASKTVLSRPKTDYPLKQTTDNKSASKMQNVGKETSDAASVKGDSSQDPFQAMGDWTSFSDQIGPLEPLSTLSPDFKLPIPEIPIPVIPIMPSIEIISGPLGPTSLGDDLKFEEDDCYEDDIFDDVLIDDLEMLDFAKMESTQSNEPGASSYIVEIDERGNEIGSDDDGGDEPQVRIGSPTFFSDDEGSSCSDGNNEDEGERSQSDFFDKLCSYWSNFNWTSKCEDDSGSESCFELTGENGQPIPDELIEETTQIASDQLESHQPPASEPDQKKNKNPLFILNIDELSKDLSSCFQNSDKSSIFSHIEDFYENSEQESDDEDQQQSNAADGSKSKSDYQDNGSYSDFDYDEDDDDDEEEEEEDDEDYEEEDNYDEFEEEDFDEDQLEGKSSSRAKKTKCRNGRTERSGALEPDLSDGYKTKSFIYDILRYEMLYDCNQFEQLQGPFQDYYRQKLGQEELEKRNSRKIFDDIYRREKRLIRRCANQIELKHLSDVDAGGSLLHKPVKSTAEPTLFEPERLSEDFDSGIGDIVINDNRPLVDILLEKFNDDPEQLRRGARNQHSFEDEEDALDELDEIEEDQEDDHDYSLDPVMPCSDSAQSTSEQSFYSLIQRSSDDIKFGELLPNRDDDSVPGLNDDFEAITTEQPSSANGSNVAQRFSFDQNVRIVADGRLLGPDPSLVLQAITMSNSSDGINLERLETVGDSFLKYSITAFLFCMCPDLNEGKLSFLRSRQISNINLHRLGQRINLGQLMNASKFEPNDNWCPPGYKVVDDVNAGTSSAVDKTNKIPYNLLTQHSIPNKSIADCVEALIGTYLISAGSQGAIQFMDWLGLKVMPKDLKLVTKNGQYQQMNTNNSDSKWLPIPKSPVIIPKSCPTAAAPNSDSSTTPTLAPNFEAKLKQFYESHRLNLFEQSLGYRFRDKAYLIQAFTHNSFYENTVTDCYQRLEFLGDAVLDYLITRYLYEDSRCHSPGTLTDLRSALVNNTFFASLAVKYNFHKYLMMLSFELYRVIDGFVRKFNLYNNADYRTAKDPSTLNPLEDEFDKDGVRSCSYWELFISENEAEHLEDIEVPKALGDIFESVAGAIFLDSGMSLDAVWKVYYPMMKPEIEYFSYNVPKSPIRVLLEKQPQSAKFGKPEITSGRKIRVCVEVFNVGKFVGVGRNKRIAKCTAAKRALRALKVIEENNQRKLGERLQKEQEYQFAEEMVENRDFDTVQFN